MVTSGPLTVWCSEQPPLMPSMANLSGKFPTYNLRCSWNSSHNKKRLYEVHLRAKTTKSGSDHAILLVLFLLKSLSSNSQTGNVSHHQLSGHLSHLMNMALSSPGKSPEKENQLLVLMPLLTCLPLFSFPFLPRPTSAWKQAHEQGALCSGT